MTDLVELTERFAPSCEQAVDVMEVAAVLEADGITDAIAAERYGSPDVFHLAGRLAAGTPRRPVATEPGAGPWEAASGRYVLRGALFALPALLYLTVSNLVSGPRQGVVVVASLLLSWAVSQGMAYLGQVRLGRGDRQGAAHVLRAGMLGAGAVVAGAILLIAAVLGAGRGAIALALGQSAYLLAATVALVVGAERSLLVALAPGVLAGVVGLAVGGGAVRSLPVAGCSAATVLATLALAVWGTRDSGKGAPATRAELLAAGPQAVFGLFSGGLLAFVPTLGVLAPRSVAGVMPLGAVAVLPLSASMGAAEWVLYRFRITTYQAMQRTFTLRAFSRRVRRALLLTVAGYLLVLAAVSGAAATLSTLLAGARPPAVPMAGYLALGGAVFVALMLMSYGVRGAVIAGCAVALALESTLAVLGLCLGRSANVYPNQFITAAGLFGVLLGYALVALSRASRHG